jgi:hypothetical protein
MIAVLIIIFFFLFVFHFRDEFETINLIVAGDDAYLLL